jgi:hypothetical protein
VATVNTLHDKKTVYDQVETSPQISGVTLRIRHTLTMQCACVRVRARVRKHACIMHEIPELEFNDPTCMTPFESGRFGDGLSTLGRQFFGLRKW